MSSLPASTNSTRPPSTTTVVASTENPAAAHAEGSEATWIALRAGGGTGLSSRAARARTAIISVLCAALVLGACGGDDGDGDSGATLDGSSLTQNLEAAAGIFELQPVIDAAQG